MAEEIRVTTETKVRDGAAPPAAEASLGELFRDLAEESATLVRQEMALAKVEMRENIRHATKDLVMIAIGGGLLLVGLLVLTAFLVALLGDLLGDEYWLGALIVGVVYAGIGGLLAMKYLNDLKKDDITPDQTIQTLKEDKQWLQNEVQEAKRELA